MFKDFKRMILIVLTFGLTINFCACENNTANRSANSRETNVFENIESADNRVQMDVYAGPGTDYLLFGSIGIDNISKAVKIEENWVEIEFDGKRGYVIKDTIPELCTEKIPRVVYSINQNIQPYPVLYNINAQISLFDDAKIYYSPKETGILGIIDAGESVTILCTEKSGINNYAQIEVNIDVKNTNAIITYNDIEYYKINGFKGEDTDRTVAASIFESMPGGFDFSSGVGAWNTHIDIETDGSFVGEYYDANMGDTGNDYPNGTVYICNFSGKFSTPEQIDEYTYSTKLESLEIEKTPGNEIYEDNTRYIYSEPYGFDDADEFLIYLPGCPLSNVSEYFLSWSYINTEIRETLPSDYYGLYNVSGMEGFVGMAENNLWEKRYVYNYGIYRSELWPHYNSMSHLVFWPETGASTLSLGFNWVYDDQTEFVASDSRGTGDYDISLKFSEDSSSVLISVKSLSGYDLTPWGGTQDGMLSAEYKCQ